MHHLNEAGRRMKADDNTKAKWVGCSVDRLREIQDAGVAFRGARPSSSQKGVSA